MYENRPLDILPGIYKEASPNAARNRWVDGNNVRFWKGFPERIGGHAAIIASGSATNAPARGVHAFRSLGNETYIGFGTANGLYLFKEGSVFDITPSGYTAGAVDSATTFDWGEGGWGSGTWSGIANAYTPINHARTWTHCNWGEDLISNYRGGPIYLWDESAGTGVDAATISGAPSDALGVFMSDTNRTLVAYGANDGSATDPLNIRWCDEEDYSVWTAAATNTAGSIRCEKGSEIIGQISSRGGHVMVTDAAVYFFQYTGGQFVFALNKMAEGPSMLGPHAGIDMRGVAVWWGHDNFYAFDGAVRDLPCDVKSYVFGRLNVLQRHKIYCGTNQRFGEVVFFYPSSTSLEIDSYVSVNLSENTWSIGSVARTSWIDSSVTVSYPVGFSADGMIYAHEFGTSANGASLTYSLKSSDLELADSGPFMHNRKLIPDYERISGSHSVSIETRGYPQRAAVTKGPYALSSATDNLSVRARGRQMRMSFSGSDDFRMGRWRYRVTGHGGRP
jgi:hypothetical protein